MLEDGRSKDSLDTSIGIMLQGGEGSSHPERYILGKPHPDRAKQFMPFAALRGFGDLIEEQMDRSAQMD